MLTEQIKISGFTVFDDSTFDFVPGINVVLGANGTGKTHVMKLLYSILRTFENDVDTPRQREARHREAVGSVLEAKLAGVFLPENARVSRLVRRVHGKGVSEISAQVDRSNYSFTLHQTSTQPVRDLKGFRAPSTPRSIFLPSREVLGLFEGFASLYAARAISVDETYADAVLALDLPPLRGPRPGLIGATASELERAIGAKVIRDGPRFYLRETGTRAKIEANLAAEGHRKVATILQLIINGALRDRAILFWDEPEANLNPLLSELVVNAISSLAKAGVQIILATHDYLIADRLSLLADSDRDAPSLRFFNLHRNDSSATEVTRADRLSHLDPNLLERAIVEHGRFQRRVKLEQLNR